MSGLDDLIEMALSKGELESGVPARIVAARSPEMAARNGHGELVEGRSPTWSEGEDKFLRENLGLMSDAEIGQALGRSEIAVHLRWKRDLGLPGPTKDPRYLTARGVGRALGVDEHKPAGWIRNGILAGEQLPSPRLIYRVLKTVLVEWATDPQNWIWFDIENVRDPRLRRMIQDASEAWGDEWWTTNQVAEYHQVHNKDVLRYIQHGKIEAVQAPNLGGRYDNPGWAHWFILKSEATREDLKFVKRKK